MTSTYRIRMSTFSWSIPGMCMTVGYPQNSHSSTFTLVDLGTGLSDGFPPGVVDAHEVNPTFWTEIPILTVRVKTVEQVPRETSVRFNDYWKVGVRWWYLIDAHLPIATNYTSMPTPMTCMFPESRSLRRADHGLSFFHSRLPGAGILSRVHGYFLRHSTAFAMHHDPSHAPR